MTFYALVVFAWQRYLVREKIQLFVTTTIHFNRDPVFSIWHNTIQAVASIPIVKTKVEGFACLLFRFKACTLFLQVEDVLTTIPSHNLKTVTHQNRVIQDAFFLSQKVVFETCYLSTTISLAISQLLVQAISQFLKSTLTCSNSFILACFTYN